VSTRTHKHTLLRVVDLNYPDIRLGQDEIENMQAQLQMYADDLTPKMFKVNYSSKIIVHDGVN
jgi:hypothetical protein